VTKWREVRHDSLIPCETKLLAADTVIRADSNLIASFQQAMFIDSIMLENYSKLAIRDSATIARLEKKLKRTRKIAYLLAAISGGAIGASLVR